MPFTNYTKQIRISNKAGSTAISVVDGYVGAGNLTKWLWLCICMINWPRDGLMDGFLKWCEHSSQNGGRREIKRIRIEKRSKYIDVRLSIFFRILFQSLSLNDFYFQTLDILWGRLKKLKQNWFCEFTKKKSINALKWGQNYVNKTREKREKEI